MSFTTKIKEELCRGELSKASAAPVLYGILYGIKSGDIPIFYTDSEIVHEFINKHFSHIIKQTEVFKKKNASQYLVYFDEKCGYEYKTAEIDRNIVKDNDNETGLFLKGVFLSCGIQSDPNKEYHLEIAPNNDEKCEKLLNLITEHGMNLRLSSRKGIKFIYTKESDLITDFLTYIGAMISAMDIMNIKIYKGVRNNVNRAVNCETANIAKTVNAAQKQQSDIKLIIDKKGIGYLSEELREAALIRLENVDLSLREIGEMLNPALSRSGVNHRFKRIGEIADQLRNCD